MHELERTTLMGSHRMMGKASCVTDEKGQPAIQGITSHQRSMLCPYILYTHVLSASTMGRKLTWRCAR